VATAEELCNKAATELLGPSKSGAPHTCSDPLIKEKPAARTLDKRTLGGSFSEAKLIQIGRVDVGYQGVLVLAMQTEAGWFWTNPLYDLGVSGVGGHTVGLERAVLRRARAAACARARGGRRVRGPERRLGHGRERGRDPRERAGARMHDRLATGVHAGDGEELGQARADQPQGR
ncbi:MAG: hypothetical protein HC927_02520, partial [Deltaproteobacteria bacterium]|nr:hypothetical protein [Deltaproteobacteria bacterium]